MLGYVYEMKMSVYIEYKYRHATPWEIETVYVRREEKSREERNSETHSHR